MVHQRRAPGWVRDMTSLSLHRLGGKLLNDFRAAGLTERQEWLWCTVINELEFRNRRRYVRDRCTCLLCVGPFEEGDESPLDRLETV